MSADAFPIASPAEVRAITGGLFRRRRLALLAAAVVLMLAAAAGLVMPNALGRVVDLVSHRGTTHGLWLLVAAMVAGVVVSALLTAVGTVLAVTLVETAVARLRERLVDHLLRLPGGRVEDAGFGEAVSRTTDDVAEISNAVKEVLPAVCGALFTIVVTFFGLAVIDWRFAVALLLVIPVQLLAVRFYLGRAPAQYAAERAAMARRAGAVLGSLRGIDSVRAHRLEPARRQLIGQHSWEAVTWTMRQRVTNNLFWGRLNAAEFLGMSGLLLVGYWLVTHGSVTTGMTTTAVLLFHRLFGPIGQLLMVIDTWQSAAASLRRIVGVLSVPVPGGREELPESIGAGAGALVVRDVTFSYHPEGDEPGAATRPTLAGVSVAIPAGRSLAVVGASGAGKSTLATVVAGLRTPQAGVVEVDGVDLAELDSGARSKVVGLGTQESHVFAATVRENLTMAAPDASTERLWEVLARVGATDWVSEFPDGLDELLGAGGVHLSEPRAQQLALARVDLLDPPVLILDEATAEAGSATATRLDAAAELVAAGRTTIVIAHRLDQASRADRIAFVADGDIVELGRHEELVAAGGRYAELWSAWSMGRSEPAGRNH